MLSLLTRLLGNPNQRKIKALEPIVDDIAHFEAELSRLSDDDLRRKTEWFKKELAARPRELDAKRDYRAEQDLLDLLLPEAFAVVREGSKRVLGMRHYDVQLIGGYVLHKGGIAEMRTGEGKTLVATLPAYLNALTGKGVHVITVNDYLAKRDAEWMGELYRFLGLTTGMVLSEQRGFGAEFGKKAAYGADITYGTNNEFGFDYLRDNMATSLGNLGQRPFNYAIIDEVDSILIDEARTPLIISGKVAQSAETYVTMSKLAPVLTKDTDYTVDEKARNVILTEDGIDRIQAMLGVEDLFDFRTNLAHHVLCAIKAKELFKRDTDYVVKDGEVTIVDEFTGRLMEGRRWSDGLHQSVEAKEGVEIQDETQTLASITFQNLFRLYPKLSGMTGTAMTEEAEFGKIYNLDVTAIPTNRPDTRKDSVDEIFKTEAIKFFRVAEEVVANHEQGRPVLVGTSSIEKSETLSYLLSDPEPMHQYLRGKVDRFAEALNKGGHTEAEMLLADLFDHPQGQDPDELLALMDREPVLRKHDIPSWLEDLIVPAVRAVRAIEAGVQHEVLNAKAHEREAMIVAQAGRYKAVTIATNMAGRGTDILLGGNAEMLVRQSLQNEEIDWHDVPPEEYAALVKAQKVLTDAEKEKVVALGGLCILGTERHESRRIDNQLRGRAGRQGDPGTSRFFLSLEDPLMRLFGGQRMTDMMNFIPVEETLPISHPWVNRMIEGAQRKVEAHHFDMRKNVLQYDDVLTEQRQLIYQQRRNVLELNGLRDSMIHMVEREMERCVSQHVTPDFVADDSADSQQALQEIVAAVHGKVPQLREVITVEALKGSSYAKLMEGLRHDGVTAYTTLEAHLAQAAEDLRTQHGVQLSGLDVAEEDLFTERGLDEAQLVERRHPLRRIEREIVLTVVDAKWIDYLHNLDALRESIGLRAYGQKDPLNEYKREAYDLFQQLTYDIQAEVVMLLFHSRIEIEIPGQQPPPMTEEQWAALTAYQQDLDSVDNEENNPTDDVSSDEPRRFVQDDSSSISV
jgi:preprotein translocase subunit SecA